VSTEDFSMLEKKYSFIQL